MFVKMLLLISSIVLLMTANASFASDNSDEESLGAFVEQFADEIYEENSESGEEYGEPSSSEHEEEIQTATPTFRKHLIYPVWCDENGKSYYIYDSSGNKILCNASFLGKSYFVDQNTYGYLKDQSLAQVQNKTVFSLGACSSGYLVNGYIYPLLDNEGKHTEVEVLNMKFVKL